MSADYDYDRYGDPRRHGSHRHHRDDRDPRYVDTEEVYQRGSPYASHATEIVRRPTREDSDLSIEEVRRDFPPPGAGHYVQHRSMVRDDRYGPPVRSRSAERGHGGAYLDDRRSRKVAAYAEEEKEVKHRRRSLSRNQKIVAAVGGAALAVGSKELWDRKQADGRPVSRNALSSAAVGAAGAFAAYEGADLYTKHKKEKEHTKTYVAHRGRDGEVDEYYSSDEETVQPKKSRRKSIVEGALGLAGLGAAAKAAGGRDGKNHSRRGSGDSHLSTRSRRSTRSRSHGRGKSPEGAAKFQQAAKAALLAGATEAFRVRKEPGGWGGDKGKRILTAAIGAGSLDAAADKDPDRHGKRHILEAVVGGLAGNRLLNGSRKDVQDDDRSTRSGRSRSRSRGPGGSGPAAGLAALATAGMGALAGKKILDHSRSRSRDRDDRSRSRGGDRRRRRSPDSYDSRSPSPRGDRKDRHKRSKSVTDYARKGLAALGIGETASSAGRDRDVREIEETHISHRSRRHGSDDDYESRRSRHGRSSRDDDYASSRGDPYGDSHYADSRSSHAASRDDDGGRSSRRKKGGRDRRVAEGKESPSDSSSDLGSSGDDEKHAKKMKGKQFLTAGLASVATIHAAHSVYQSMEKRQARQKAVAEGEMSPEEARKLKGKAILQDAASIGIAALGIKGAYSEIKEANHLRHECKEFREKKEERHKKRLERQNGSSNGGGRSRSNGYAAVQNSGRDHGPRYIDDNPYSAALPAPPIDHGRR